MRQQVNSGERFRRGNAITIQIVALHTCLAELHVEPHLVIGDVAAGHLDGSLQEEGPFRYPAGLDHQTARSPKGCQANCCGAVAFDRAIRWTPSVGQESGRLKRESHSVSNAPPYPRGTSEGQYKSSSLLFNT